MCLDIAITLTNLLFFLGMKTLLRVEWQGVSDSYRIKTHPVPSVGSRVPWPSYLIRIFPYPRQSAPIRSQSGPVKLCWQLFEARVEHNAPSTWIRTLSAFADCKPASAWLEITDKSEDTAVLRPSGADLHCVLQTVRSGVDAWANRHSVW